MKLRTVACVCLFISKFTRVEKKVTYKMITNDHRVLTMYRFRTRSNFAVFGVFAWCWVINIFTVKTKRIVVRILSVMSLDLVGSDGDLYFLFHLWEM